VEFKTDTRRTFDTRDYTAWLAQAVTYTHTEWSGYGRLMIFTCPSAVGPLRRVYGDCSATLVTHLLGQFGVGELAKRGRQGWTLVLHGDHVLWSE
jgi:hypothetical protein